MTLVEAITNLTGLVTQMVQAQQQASTGMTAEQAALLQQTNADVQALKSGLQAVLGAMTTHTEQLAALAQQLQANAQADAENAAADAALRAAIGDTSQLG